MSRLTRSSFLFALFAAGVVPLIAQPAVSALWNNYSGTKPGLPNYGISPGSLFVIAGSNLTTTSNTTEAFPLTTTLGGTSVSVTVNGTTTQPSLYYVLPTQIAAVLPEGTPVGIGTLTVTNSAGQTSASVPIQVVQSDFGILTDNGAGFGPAAAFDTNYVPISATHPAAVGQLIDFWGTGAGPDPANDDKTVPQQENNLTSVPFQVYIGGVLAPVVYKGRSAYPGVDQVFITIPAGVTPGCYVSVVMVSGSLGSNYATIPVAPQGAASCTDQASLLSSFSTLVGRSSANVAELTLISQTTQTGTQSQTVSTAMGQFKTDNAVQLYSELISDGLVSVGSCVVSQGNSTGSAPGLSAGSSLTLSGPGGEQASLLNTPGNSPLYAATLPGTFVPASGGTFTISGAGGAGAQVGSFNVPVTLPPPITWTNMSAASSIVRPQGFVVNWTGAASGGVVLITGDSTGSAGIDVKFQCLAPATDGTFTIPPQVLASLPNSTTGASLGLTNIANPSTFSASGLDLGFVYGGFASVTQLANYQPTAVAAPHIQSLSLGSSQTTSGSSVQGTVLLSSLAPPAGVTVTLSSSSTDAKVPSTITVPAGALTANFTITVGTVSTTENVTITATYQGSSSQAVLTIIAQQGSGSSTGFNGNYTGTYLATSGTNSATGPVAATINNGTVTVTVPNPGTGTITSSGQITFGVVISAGVSCTFSGQLNPMGTGVTGNGTFSCNVGGITGTWSVSRQ